MWSEWMYILQCLLRLVLIYMKRKALGLPFVWLRVKYSLSWVNTEHLLVVCNPTAYTDRQAILFKYTVHCLGLCTFPLSRVHFNHNHTFSDQLKGTLRELHMAWGFPSCIAVIENNNILPIRASCISSLLIHDDKVHLSTAYNDHMI